MDTVWYLYHYELKIKYGCGVKMLCVLFDQSTAGIFAAGTLQFAGVGDVPILYTLVRMDRTVPANGVYRILYKKG